MLCRGDRWVALCHKIRSLGSSWNNLLGSGSVDTGGRFFVTAAVLLAIGAGGFFFFYSAIGTDDALIYFRVARNIVSGVGPVINAGDFHSPVTSLLWAYLLAWASVLSGCSNWSLLAMAMDATLIALSSLMLSFSIRRQMGSLALLVPFGLVSVELFRVLPGLETCLAIFGLSLVCWCFFSLDSLPLTGMALGFGFFCRGDVVLLTIPIGLIVLIRLAKNDGSVTLGKVMHGVASMGIFLALGIFLQNLETGHFLPATMHAKILQGQLGPWSTFGKSGLSYVWQALDRHWFFAVMAVIGLIVSRGIGFTLVAAAFLHWLSYSILSVADYPWYSWLIMLSLRLNVVLGIGFVARGCVFGLWAVFQSGNEEKMRIIHQQLLNLASVLVAFVFLFMVFSVQPVGRFKELPHLSSSPFNIIYFQIADAVCGNRTDIPTVDGPFLGQEIGMVSFLCPDREIRDVNGLASPGIDAENLNNWKYWVSVYNPAYLCFRGTCDASISFTVSGRKLEYAPLMNLQEKGFRVSLLIQAREEMKTELIGAEKGLSIDIGQEIPVRFPQIQRGSQKKHPKIFSSGFEDFPNHSWTFIQPGFVAYRSLS